MKNYSSAITGANQQQPIPGRNMTKNNAGGFGFEATPQQRLERFLLIGSEGGTYYVKERELTIQNATNVIALLKTDGLKVVETVVDFATNHRAPKADAGIFVLALATAHGDDKTKKAAYAAVPRVCRTSTQLFSFLANVQKLRGWSRGLRTAVSKFYTEKTAEQVAYQMVKYRNRAGFTHKDALRLSHAKATNPELNNLFGYATEKTPVTEVTNPLVRAFESAQTSSGKELVGLINEFKLTWEMVPNDKLNDKEVLSSLLEYMPLTALIRNLNRFSYNAMTESLNTTVKKIVAKLTDAEAVKKAGVHPVNVVNSLLTYSSGRGQKGDKTWAVNQNIADALNDTYELALKALIPTGKSLLVGVDISGSMQAEVGGMLMNCSQIANVLAVTILKSEKNSEMVWFDTNIQKANLSRRSSIRDILANSPNGGGTDCAQPIVHALATKTKYDAILILTDSETWAGSRHAIDALDEYRRRVNRDVKVVEIAMAANASSTMPDNDLNILRIVGFDASVTEVINQFLK
jgi:60 kDa SS-A/Ro ribonucleoprotein